MDLQVNFSLKCLFLRGVFLPKLPKLTQKPNVILKHEADVVDRVHQGGHSFQPKTEGKTGINLMIDAATLQNVWMDHAASAKFNPARSAAGAALPGLKFAVATAFETRKIEFGTWLGKREITRTKPRIRFFSVHPAQPLSDGSL